MLVLAFAFAVDAAIAAGLGFVFPGVLSFWEWFVAVILFCIAVNFLKSKS